MEKAAVHMQLLTVPLVLHVQNGGQESFQGGVLLIGFRVIGGILAAKIRKAKASIIQEVINKRRCQMYRQENGKHNCLWDQLT